MDRPPQPDGPDASVPALTKQALASRYPFVPYGLVPLAGLLALMFIALAPFAFGEVQAVTEATARAALQKSGATWATATASGQWVVLEGRPPSREAAAEAERVVRQARADTLFGPAAPATWAATPGSCSSTRRRARPPTAGSWPSMFISSH